jgi:hypothetical protein
VISSTKFDMVASMQYHMDSAHPVTHNGGFINLSSGSLLSSPTVRAELPGGPCPEPSLTDLDGYLRNFAKPHDSQVSSGELLGSAPLNHSLPLQNTPLLD